MSLSTDNYIIIGTYGPNEHINTGRTFVYDGKLFTLEEAFTKRDKASAIPSNFNITYTVHRVSGALGLITSKD